MKAIITFFLLLFSSVSYSQEMTVTIELSKTYFKSTGSGWEDDSLYITARIKNNGSETALLRNADGFIVSNTEGNGWGHCFRVYPLINTERRFKPDYERTPDAFVEIKPGEELVKKGAYSIGWICRGAPHDRPWKLSISYHRIITKEDNYCLFKSYYTENYEKEYVDAWMGTLKSNEVDIVIE